MNPELQEQYDNYFEMFRTQGWKQFIEDMSEVYDSFYIEDIKDELELYKIKGERKVLNQIINFENSIKTSHENLLEDYDD
jgi:hypothetical protein